jgi:hypothetical protein
MDVNPSRKDMKAGGIDLLSGGTQRPRDVDRDDLAALNSDVARQRPVVIDDNSVENPQI